MKVSSVVAGAAIAGYASAKAGKDTSVHTTTTVTVHGTTKTHKYGRFNHTSRTHPPKNSGTHKYGKFNRTMQPATTTVYLTGAETKEANPVHAREYRAAAHHNGTNGTHGTNGTNGTNGSNGSFTTSHDNAGAMVGAGASFGVAAGAAAVALALL